MMFQYVIELHVIYCRHKHMVKEHHAKVMFIFNEVIVLKQTQL